jgi:hypothetical protein
VALIVNERPCFRGLATYVPQQPFDHTVSIHAGTRMDAHV